MKQLSSNFVEYQNADRRSQSWRKRPLLVPKEEGTTVMISSFITIRKHGLVRHSDDDILKTGNSNRIGSTCLC
jgi:hypothetical protein